MYELCNVTGNTYYINCPAKIGLYIDGINAYLIDSGNDKDAGKKVKRLLDENGWNLVSIINTHSHADHIGGNKYLQSHTDCKVYAKGIECAFINSPILEPSLLYGGCPGDELLHKFLFAESSICSDISKINLSDGFQIIDLPGHSFEMIGVRTPDNVIFIADSISSAATLRKYGIGYTYDISKQLNTLDRLLELDGAFYIPSHDEASTDIYDVVQLNKQKIYEIIDFIKSLLVEALTFENILSLVFDKYNLIMTNEQNVLIGSTVKSYLTYLKSIGEIDTFFDGNKKFWCLK